MTTETQTRSWVIDMPPGTDFLTLNQANGLHWAKVRKAHGEYQGDDSGTKGLRALIRAARLPRLERADIVLEYTSPPRLRRLRHPLHGPRVDDQDNLGLVLKWSVDAFVKEGVLSSDIRRRVTSRADLTESVHPRGQLRIHITEVTGGD